MQRYIKRFERKYKRAFTLLAAFQGVFCWRAARLTQTELPCSLDLTYARNAAIGMAYSIYSLSYAEALSTGHSNKHTSPSVQFDHQAAALFFSLPQKVIGHAVFDIFCYFVSKDLFLEKVSIYNTQLHIYKQFVFFLFYLSILLPLSILLYIRKRDGHMLIYAVLPDKGV